MVMMVAMVRRHQQRVGGVLVADGGDRRRISRLHRLRQSGEVELVRVPLAMYFRHDVLVVVVTQSAAHLVVIHVRLALAFTPASSNLVWISHLELTRRAFPRDARRVAVVRQQFQEKLPQLDLTAACQSNNAGNCINRLNRSHVISTSN